MEIIVWSIIGLISFVLFLMSFYIIRPTEEGIIERLGKYHGKKTQGFHFLIPFIDSLYRVKVYEETVDVPKQPVITKDNVNVMVDGVVYLRVTDTKKSLYEINNYKVSLTTLAQTNLRSIIGTMELDQVLNNRDMINTRMVTALDNITNGWGVDITRMEIQELTPPTDILKAMEAQVTAERMKRKVIIDSEAKKEEAVNIKTAEITKAEGDKKSSILQAEGDKESKILRATGDATAITKKGKAEADAIKAINAQMKTQGQKYIELKRLEAWDGTVPQFVSGESSPFLFNMPTPGSDDKTKDKKKR